MRVLVVANRLYVGGLPFETTDDELKKMFDPSGTVTSATVAVDKGTGRSKGFGFVEMPDDEEAKSAVSSLNGTTVGGREIKVEVANPPRK
jgi:RNA recognition motif-containing protein